MSLTTTVQEWMRSVGPREEAIFTARNHVLAETSTDTDVICATVSHDVFFGVPVRTRQTNEIPDGTVLTTYDQVRGYYSGRAGAYVVLASAQLKSIATDWYVFNESAATLRGTGMIGDQDATGREFVVNSAVLFPTAADGIRGEVCVTRYPFDDIVADTVVMAAPIDDPRTHLPLREMSHCELLDRVAAALRSADQRALTAELAERHTMAVRLDDVDGAQRVHTATDAAAAVAELHAMFDGAEDLTLTTRIATDWYIFAEYLLRLDDQRVRRLAITHPVFDGRLGGSFGYGRDEFVAD